MKVTYLLYEGNDGRLAQSLYEAVRGRQWDCLEVELTAQRDAYRVRASCPLAGGEDELQPGPRCAFDLSLRRILAYTQGYIDARRT